MVQATLTNTCTCQYCEQCECSYSYVDEKECPECKAEMKFYNCYGYCYQGARDDMISLIEQWQSDNKIDTIAVDGSRMGWTNDSGSDVFTSAANALEALNIRTEWTLRLTREDDSLRIVRSSHDELGALFTFRAATQQEKEEK